MTWFFPTGSLLPAQQPSLADQTAAITFSRLNENFLSWDEEPLGERLWLWHRHHMTWNRKIFGGPKQGLQGSGTSRVMMKLSFSFRISLDDLKLSWKHDGRIDSLASKKKTMRLASKWDHTPQLKKKNGKMLIPENPKIATNPESHLQSQGIPETNNLLAYQFTNVAMEECLENAPFNYRWLSYSNSHV